MMRYIILTFTLGLIVHNSFSQDTSKVFVKRLYLSLGSAITNRQLHGGLNASIISELDKYYIIALRRYHTGYRDKNYPTPYDLICFGCPTYIINEYNLTLGKTFNVNKYLGVSITTGPSYVKYYRPVNIRKSSGWFSLGYYNYDIVQYDLFGWSSRLDINVLPLKFLGISVGGYYNYNSMLPTGGLNATLLIGRLRRKHIA